MKNQHKYDASSSVKVFSGIEIKEQKQMKTYSYNHFLFFCFILGAFLLGLLSPAYALSVITTKEIDSNLPNGAIESMVVLGKRVLK